MRPRAVRSRVVLVAISLLAPVLGVLPTGTAAAVPGGPVALFDPPSAGWLSYRDQTSSQFADTFADRRRDYLPVDLDVETAGGYRVGSVWQRNTAGRAWRLKRNLTAAAYTAYWEDARDDGYRLVEHETYLLDGQRRYAGIWIGNREGLAWASRRGQTAAQLATSTATYREAGLMPVDVDSFVLNGSVRYSTVWVASQNRDWRLVRGVTEATWENQFDALSGTFRVLAFDSLRTGAGQRYSAVFVTNDSGRAWAARRDLSARAFGNHWYRYRDLGFRLVGFNRYSTSSGVRYSGVWRQNSARPNWSRRAAFDQEITQRLDAVDFTGVSVAVYDDGVPLYLRGFGEADDGVWLDATHTGNIASVSKAVAGVLTFRMIERGELDLDDATRDWVPTMPVNHTHTVGQLLSNRGCIRHYTDGLDGDLEGRTFATALAAAPRIWDDPLVAGCDPVTSPSDNYSTHGYTLLGAALEAAGGDDVRGLVRSRLTTPYSLGTLGPQRFTGHRMSVHASDGDEVDVPRNDWKVLGGGLDSSVTDLARFGDRLADGDFLTPTSLDEMWSNPDTTAHTGYGYGWELGTTSGYEWVGKNGAGTGCGAYLLMYPGLGITVAVMANQRAGSPDAKKFFSLRLAHALGAMLLPPVG